MQICPARVAGARGMLLLTLTLFGVRGLCLAAEPIYVEFFDGNEQLIAGPVRLVGHRGSLEGLAFLHAWSRPFDAQTGFPTGRARQDRLDLTVPIGPASPILIDTLTHSRTLSRIVFHFVRGTPVGEEEFYRVTVRQARIIGREMRLFDVLESANAQRDLVETYSFTYDAAEIDAPETLRQLLYLPGDTNGDLQVNISDAIQLLGYLFLGSEMRCPLSGDTNADEKLDVSDGVALLNYLFLGSRQPPPPFPGCGEVPQGKAIPCGSTACEAAGQK